MAYRNTTEEAQLCAKLADYCTRNDLQLMSADELLIEVGHASPHAKWLADFIAAWDATQNIGLQINIDSAQRELNSRSTQGEDVSLLRVCQETAQIVEVDEYACSHFDDRELCGEHYAGF